MIDFSKAFTTDDHAILLNKFAQLKLPVVNWVCFFLSGRGQQRLTLHIILKSDQHTLSEINYVFKYARYALCAVVSCNLFYNNVTIYVCGREVIATT